MQRIKLLYKNINQKIRQSVPAQYLAQKTLVLRQKWRQFKTAYPRAAWSVKWIGGFSFLGFLALFLFCFLIYVGAFGSLPTYADLRDIQNDTASEVYSEDGVLLGKYYIENRIKADFEEISPNIINALVATEDARFFDHSGVDLRAAVRVLYKSILLNDDSSGGGSTLSQQLIKNLYPRKSYWMLETAVNKIREMLVARRIEKIYAKKELLSLYLNTVPFSDNVFGVKVAAQRFFSKSPENLNIEEAAVLVGILKATTYYHPVNHPERALTRRNTVLGQMQKYGYIKEVEFDSLKLLPLNLNYSMENNNQGLATYFREHLRQELDDLLANVKKPDGSSYNLYTDGLKIHTSINARLQQYAEEAVKEHMAKVQMNYYNDWKKGVPWGRRSVLDNAVQKSKRYQDLKARGLAEESIMEVFEKPVKMRIYNWKGGEEEKEMSPLDSVKYYLTLLNAGFLAIQPQTGTILAWVGGVDHKYFQYDHVKSRRQVGSTFKPIVYAQALRSGIQPCEYTHNRQVSYAQFDNWQPRNSNGQYGGVYSMEGALSQSINSVTVDLLLRAGIDSVRQLAQSMGIDGPIPAVPSIALGAADASLREMIEVYGSFANRGVRPQMHYLDTIKTSDGKILLAFERPNPEEFERVLSEKHADIMNRMLQSVVDSGTARRLRYEFGLYNQIAGKTGTTQNHSDGWFLGYTPNLVAGAWVGAELPSVHFRTMRKGQGASTALPIFGRFLRKMYKDENFRAMRKAEFESPHDSVLVNMTCPPYLDHMPIMADLLRDFLENPALFDYLFREGIFLGQEGRLELPPPKEGETEEEYIDRLRKYADRMERRDERREKRKQFWSNLLFGDKDKKNERRERNNF